MNNFLIGVGCGLMISAVVLYVLVGIEERYCAAENDVLHCDIVFVPIEQP